MRVQDLFNLQGKIAIVTGGSRGLGEEMAEGLGEAGASLMLCARREQWLGPTLEEFKKKGIAVEGMICDVAKPAQVKAVVDKTADIFGRVDILVNNAGISWGAYAEEMPLERWQQVIDVNLTGAMVFAQECAKHMIPRRYGRIINIASVAGYMASTLTPYAGYVATKHGLLGLTKQLAAEWAKYNIRVNAISPGYFPSRMTEKVLPLVEKWLKEDVPMGRAGKTGELKGVAVFLASDASNYITGQSIVVDGGSMLV